ncbi:unnamed protein product [[Candida] boidinii]|nr:unnamed protein product [[Candida] boidinii]
MLILMSSSQESKSKSCIQSASGIQSGSNSSIQSAILNSNEDIQISNNNSFYKPPMTSRVINGSPGYGKVSHIKLLQDPFIEVTNKNSNFKNNLFSESESESEFKIIDTKENYDDNNSNNNNESHTIYQVPETCDSFEDTFNDTNSSNCAPIDIGTDNNNQVISPKSGLHSMEIKEHRSPFFNDIARPASEWIKDIKNSEVYKIFGEIADIIDTSDDHKTTLSPNLTSKSRNSIGFTDYPKNEIKIKNEDKKFNSSSWCYKIFKNRSTNT